MISEGRVYNPSKPLADQSTHPLRFGPEGGAIMQSAHGSSYLSTISEVSFSAANPGAAGVVTTVATATTYTGLCLSNPIGSDVIISIDHVHAAFSVVFPAACHIGIMTGYHATTDVVHTTPVTPVNSKIGIGGAGKAKVDSSATLPIAPTVRMLFGHALASAAGSYSLAFTGGLQLIPGAFVAIYTSTVSGAAALMGSYSWEEINF